jgi:hypothetical protein
VASNDFRSQKSKEYWKYLEENYKEVTSWPGWMKGESPKMESGAASDVECPGLGNQEKVREQG